jgi:serine/threonine-protein kinase
LRRLSGYTIERELGGGGMSRVFLATEVALGRRVAIKVLESARAEMNAERFRREIQLAARLQHPHIVPLLSAGEIDGLAFYVMPYVEGESLRLRLQQGPLEIAEALRLLRNVAAALGAAHQQGIVHRDIKPDNILVSGGVAVVLDFGVSKAIAASTEQPSANITGAGMVVGTPRYMAPEQVGGDPDVDHRADIYAFGILAYELLTGSPPFAGNDPVRLLRAHLADTAQPVNLRRPDAPPAISRMIMRCLEKDRALRPQSAHEVLELLDSVGTPSQLPASKATQVLSRTWQHAAGAVLLTVAYLVACGLMVAGLRWLALQGEVSGRVVVLCIVGSLVGLPIVVAAGVFLRLRNAERARPEALAG